MKTKFLSPGLTASPNQRPPPSPAFSSPPFPGTSNATSIPINPLGDGGVKPPSQAAPTGKAKAKQNKTMKKALRIMSANHQLPALPKQNTASKLDQEERLSDSDDNDTSHHMVKASNPAAAPRVPTSQRTAHVPLKPHVQTPAQKDDAKTKPPQANPFKEPKRLGRPPGKRVDPSPPVQAMPGSARERIQAAGLGPQVVEQNLVRHALGKLNPVQMEAAKRRANIASQPFLPSKDGFRMSVHEVKSKERVKEAGAKAELRPGGDDDEEFFCPSRQSTAPTCIAPTASSDQKVPIRAETKSNEAEQVKHTDSTSRTESSKSSEQEGSKSEAEPEVENEPGKAASNSLKAAQVGKEAERTSSIESLNEDLNLSDSEGEEEESGKVATKLKKTADEKGKVGKGGPIVEAFEEDNYDALDFDLSSDSDEENMEVDKNDDELVEKEEAKAAEKEPAGNGGAVVDNNLSSPASVASKVNLSENDGQGHPLKSQGAAKNGKGAAAKMLNKKKKTFASLLESLDYGWKTRSTEDMANLKKERENLSKERQSFAYEAQTDVLKKNFKNLMGSQNEESFGRLVDSIAATRSLPGCCIMVCDLAYQQLVGEHKDTPLLR